MTKIRVFSDLHLEFAPFTPPAVDPLDLIILAGDITVGYGGPAWARTTFSDNEIIYVTGNHEPYCKVDLVALQKALMSERKVWNVHYLQNHFVKINGIRIVGGTLWTDFDNNNPLSMLKARESMNDFRLIKSSKEDQFSFRPEEAYENHKATLAFLQNEGKNADIVVTHHAPSFQSIGSAYVHSTVNGAYASNLEWLIEEMQPDYWFHGHIHQAKDYKIGKTRVVCNPRGYPGQKTGFDLDIAFEI